VTLLELMIVTGLIALVVGISFPSFSAGLDTLRLNQATSGVVNFFNEALNRAERRQEVVAISILQAQNTLVMQAAEPGFERRYELPQGISIEKILPPDPEQPVDAPRQFLLLPGGAVPRAGVELVNQRHVHRVVYVDPITGVPRIETPAKP
jgi:type II secretory pathway pseudopilin PulG